MSIPAGSTYLYDLASSPKLGEVVVRGRLVFDDTKDISLDALGLIALDNGEILIGTPPP